MKSLNQVSPLLTQMKKVDAAAESRFTYRMNYFDLLGVKQSFDLDLEKLEKNYMSLQQNLHPDRFINSSPSERLAVTQKVADINDGYGVLRSFQKRAQYILELSGYSLSEKELSQKVSQEVLMESMEYREELSDAHDVVDIEALTRKVAKEKKILLKELSQAFSDNECDRSFNLFIRLKYIDKFLHEAKLQLLKTGQDNVA